MLQEAVSNGIQYQVPESMLQHFKDNVYVFSGCKTYAQLREVSDLLLNDQGKPKSFSKFKQDTLKIHNQYNKHYLESEYLFAKGTARMASKWEEFLADGDNYNIQYRTAGDGKVREVHRNLEGITLPPSDPFWNSYLPKNGWRCRCDVVQVRKSKYPTSNPQDAIIQGERATYTKGKGGVNTSAMFRFNAHKQKVIFPPTHPYFNNKEVVSVMKGQIENDFDIAQYIKGKIPTNQEVKTIFMEYAKQYPDDFRRGLENIKFSKTKKFFMQHSMLYNPTTKEWTGGSILTLSNHEFSQFNPANELKGALGAIKKKEKLTFNQEYAIESIWHEILHAKTQTKPQKLDSIQVAKMETLNQFCARHTYNEFLERLGGKAMQQKEILEKGYGYASLINTFRADLEKHNIEEKTALEQLMPKLMTNYGTIEKEMEVFIEKNKRTN